jgi:hypothetical protein
LQKQHKETELIAEYTKFLCRKGSKAEEMMQNVLNNVDEWDIGKSNRWIGYAQCLLVAEGKITIDELRDNIRKIADRES